MGNPSALAMGDTMIGATVARVIESRNPDYALAFGRRPGFRPLQPVSGLCSWLLTRCVYALNYVHIR